MAYLLKLSTHGSERGFLTVAEQDIPFTIKRVFFIYNVDDSERGKHRHHKTIQAAICIKGSCIISNDDNITRQDFVLDSPEKCLILEPKDWHSMHHFTSDAILLVLASENFEPLDYIYEPYR